ncbi:hypothetical protein Ade02nite_14400 [Paractinoplanes deccanensis]|uniref:Uncharacterized protein n=1 Tax=Paractinoplanes deccanensis TaxID=113561 RepID=A0ABQ3XYH1_9ACTN|nr:hypothetical protein [Actinoplanes deccanensis]GID72799.1 hypothetical protein Ade02nite_14400 [Actinoplanes deccanensis]
MSRTRYRAPGRTWLSRRKVLALAATGVGASAVSVAGLSLAGENGDAGDTGDGSPLVVSIRDAKKGTIDVFSGDKLKTITDRKLAASLIKAAGRA